MPQIETWGNAETELSGSIHSHLLRPGPPQVWPLLEPSRMQKMKCLGCVLASEVSIHLHIFHQPDTCGAEWRCSHWNFKIFQVHRTAFRGWKLQRQFHRTDRNSQLWSLHVVSVWAWIPFPTNQYSKQGHRITKDVTYSYTYLIISIIYTWLKNNYSLI